MSKKNDTKKQHTSNRKVEVAKAGKRAGSLSPKALEQKAVLSAQRHEAKLEFEGMAVESIIKAFREDGTHMARHTGIVYNMNRDAINSAIDKAEVIFSCNRDRLADFIAVRRSKGQNLGFYEISSRYTYRELMAAQVQYKTNNKEG